MGAEGGSHERQKGSLERRGQGAARTASFDPAVKTAALCRDIDLSPRTLYAWRDQCTQGGSERLAAPSKSRDPEKARLVKENDRLKKIVGELTLANDALEKTTLRRAA